MRIGGKSFPCPPHILGFEEPIFRDDNNAREKKSTEATKSHHCPIRLNFVFAGDMTSFYFALYAVVIFRNLYRARERKMKY